MSCLLWLLRGWYTGPPDLCEVRVLHNGDRMGGSCTAQVVHATTVMGTNATVAQCSMVCYDASRYGTAGYIMPWYWCQLGQHSTSWHAEELLSINSVVHTCIASFVWPPDRCCLAKAIQRSLLAELAPCDHRNLKVNHRTMVITLDVPYFSMAACMIDTYLQKEMSWFEAV